MIKINFLLERDYGIKISLGRVYRLVKTMNLPQMSTKKFKNKYAIHNSDDCENHLKQNFNQNAPNVVWVSDFTYLRAGNKWHYLCVILDLFSRKVIAYKLSPRADVELVRETFLKAFAARNPSGLMFHSDRGC